MTRHFTADQSPQPTRTHTNAKRKNEMLISIDINDGIDVSVDVDVTLTWVADNARVRAKAEWDTIVATGDGATPPLAAMQAVRNLLRHAGKLTLTRCNDARERMELESF